MNIFKVKPLAEILASTKQQLDAALAPLRARRVKAKAEMKLADNEAKLIGYETRVNELCAKEEIDFDAVIDAMDEHTLLSRRNEQLKTLIADLFPTDQAVA